MTAGDDRDDEPRTVFNPGGFDAPPPARPTPNPDAPPLPPHTPAQSAVQPTVMPAGATQMTGTGFASFAPRGDGKSIQVGDVLNHIFEVKRFIARGGMGEVFEGINVNSDERVAIKVMLPALAADPNVISMFRKEARTLTRLQHEALVNYRVLAQEPQLGVLYIVTEYVDGTNLADVLGQLRPSSADLKGLLRRLASGLRAAHQLGAIHRDMSPDNVLLEEGRLDRAKIIDFGIAKDLDPGSATIVGEGFAGKLNYVAPEQLGDFGRQVGPWTDVYSLGLVVLAVAGGRNVAMGGSLVDAVDKRRAGPDLSAAPDDLRPILADMLRANPEERLRSMEAVIARLDGPPQGGASGAGAAAAPPKRGGKGMLIGGVIAALLIAGLLIWLVAGRGGEPADIAQRDAAPDAPTAASRDPLDVARSAVNATLPSVSCTWLSLVEVGGSGAAPAIKLTGVAGNPSAAQSEIGRALSGQGIQNANIDFSEVSPITPAGCAALDTYRQVRNAESPRLSVPQRKFEMRVQGPEAGEWAGRTAANAVVELNIGDPTRDFALVGLEPSGVIQSLIHSRAEFEEARKTGGLQVQDLGGDRYRVELQTDHSDWSGILLVSGKGPFESGRIAPVLGARGPDWTNSFVSEAAGKGWQTDMVWYKTVDEVRE